jgi:hypothetical protein
MQSQYGAYTGETKHVQTTRVLSNQLISEQINHHTVHHLDCLSNNPHRTMESGNSQTELLELF